MKILYKTSSLCVFQSALFQTNATVINTPDCILVIDPNWLPDEIHAIKKHVKKCGDKPIYLVFTHSDYDHIIGYGAFPEAVGVIASRAFTENPDKEKTLEQIRKFDDDYYIIRNYAIEYPTVTHVIAHDNQILKIGDTELQFWLAPGHNPDGIFMRVENVIVVGDYFCSVEFPYIYFNSYLYESTIERDFQIRTLHKPVFVCGHGDIIARVTRTELAHEVERRKELSLDYIRRVRASVKNPDKNPFDFDAYVKTYNFPCIMRRFHDKNVALMRIEEFGEPYAVRHDIFVAADFNPP